MPADCDILVIGGGIHGVGVMQAAAAAGYRSLLIEKDDLAHGTSGRSSKLIHGGLRYLERARLGLVRESLAEREILLRIAPDLVHLVPFYLPIYRDTSRRPWQVRLGLTAYALLGGLRANARFQVVPRDEWPSLDGLRTRGLQVVYRYWDAQTDDALLTRAVAGSAISLGAEVLLRTSFVSADRLEDAYRVVCRTDGRQREIRCRALVNAAGPWVNRVLAAVRPPPRELAVEYVQGAHIVLEGRIRRGVYYTEAPRDRRAVFIMPWREKTLVGTTETPFRGDPEGVRPSRDEVAYLQETVGHFFPSLGGGVVEAFAGLRVLPRGRASAFHRTREMILLVDSPRDPRLVTLYGGKLTAFRSSAQKVLGILRRVLPPRTPVADTATLPLRPESLP